MAPNVQLYLLKETVKSAAIALGEVLSNLVINVQNRIMFYVHYTYFSASFIIPLVADCSLGCRKVEF